MIVTCESCKSRYKLDDAKITGRGAKITCPKCKSVFVVYARTEGPPPGAARGAGAPDVPGTVVAKSGPPVPSPSAPPDKFEDEEPTRIADGGDRAPARPAAPMRGAAPTDGPTSPPGTPLPSPQAAAPTPPPKPAAPAPPAPSAAEIAARAASLDFRKVGVTTWKVKVKIGLVYDFSDIRTLRKYIQDGRVTPTDVVSWDGKAWRAIGDIPDLDAFFVETWEMLAARKVEGDTLSPTPAPEAPRAEEPSAPRTADTPQKNGGEPNQFQDPFEEMRRKQKDKAELRRTQPVPVPSPATPAAKPESKSRAPMLLLALLVLLLAGGGWWWTTQRAGPGPSGPPSAAGKPAAKPGDKNAKDDLRKQLDQQLQDSIARTPAPPEESPKDDGATPTDIRGAGEGANPLRPVGGPPEGASRVPEGATPRIPRGTPVPSTAPIQQADQTAQDHEAVGDDAAKGGDWSTAITAYKKAVALDPKSAKLAGKLGRAQYEAGDLGGAQATLETASKLGSKDAAKYLGHIARKNGDVPGANNWYQKYLSGNPGDAAEIQQLMTQMNGG